ncbi:hypothetical protein IGI37_000817 [Enterococcus sp. AZ194]|uniref:hypothetical protein n=1 Tax=Enterococcus sp. AZ194 TaxID=2774629 RepID=UPI003F24B688
MIDLLVSAARFDFFVVKKSASRKLSDSVLQLVLMTVLSISLIFAFQLSKMNTTKALTIVQEESYRISQGEISFSDEKIQQVNQKLSETGYQISKTAIFLEKNELLSFRQLLSLCNREELENKQIAQMIEKDSSFVEGFIWFYFYIKEAVVLIWILMLSIVLARGTKKYVRRVEIHSYQRIFGWVAILVVDPLLIYTVMSLLSVRWSYRIFIFTLVYVMIVFIFSRYLIAHVKIEGES